MTQATSRRVRLIVRGRVQGVGFRYSARREAVQLGLTGWVRNLVDGGVEVVAEGDQGAVATLVTWCSVGPPGARVDRVEQHNPPVGPLPDPFSIKY